VNAAKAVSELDGFKSSNFMLDAVNQKEEALM
jgi:hypothetical protein